MPFSANARIKRRPGGAGRHACRRRGHGLARSTGSSARARARVMIASKMYGRSMASRARPGTKTLPLGLVSRKGDETGIGHGVDRG